MIEKQTKSESKTKKQQSNEKNVVTSRRVNILFREMYSVRLSGTRKRAKEKQIHTQNE